MSQTPHKLISKAPNDFQSSFSYFPRRAAIKTTLSTQGKGKSWLWQTVHIYILLAEHWLLLDVLNDSARTFSVLAVQQSQIHVCNMHSGNIGKKCRRLLKDQNKIPAGASLYLFPPSNLSFKALLKESHREH